MYRIDTAIKPVVLQQFHKREKGKQMNGRKERHRYYTIMVQRSDGEAREPGEVGRSMVKDGISTGWARNSGFGRVERDGQHKGGGGGCKASWKQDGG